MTTFVAVLAGLGTMIGVNIGIGAVRAIACASSQFLNMLLRFSVLALPIRMVGWFAAAWVGLSVYAAINGPIFIGRFW